MCMISGNPLPESVTWKCNDEAIDFEGSKGSYNETVSTMEVEGKRMRVFNLIIKQLSVAMDGNKYECIPPDDSNLAKVPPSIEIEVERKSEPCTLILLITCH